MIDLTNTTAAWLISTGQLGIIEQYVSQQIDLLKKSNKTMKLSVSSIFGPVWNGTPMQMLYDHYRNNSDAFSKAAYDAGIILNEIMNQRSDITQISNNIPYEYKFK